MAPKKRQARFDDTEKPIPLMVRLPPHLHALVDDASKRQHRSLNAQVIHIISWYFGGESGVESPSLTDAPT